MSAFQESVGEYKQLKVLIVEDSEIDAGLMAYELERFGYDVSWRRVESAAELKLALRSLTWDVVLSDYAMPHFNGLEALEIVRTCGFDLPFVLVSGTIGEEVAVEAMRAGANDYLLKDRMARLGPAVERELREAEGRKARKRAEEALRASEERLRLAWQTTPDALTISTLKDGTYVDVNPGYVDLTGYSRQEVIGRSVQALRFWEDPDDRRLFVEGLLEHGRVKDLETKIRCKNGAIKTVLMSAALMHLEGEQHLLAVTKDIEEVKSAQKAVARSEELFRKYFELGLVGMALISPEKGWVYVNDRICQLLGYPREELCRTKWPELTHPDDLEPELRQFGRMLAGEIEGYSLEKRFLHKEGSIVYAMLHVTCMRRPEGTVEHVIVHLDDITDQKRDEQVLQRHAKELEDINRLGREISSKLSREDIVIIGLRDLISAVHSDCAVLFLLTDDNLVLQGFEPSLHESPDEQFPILQVGECLCGLSVRDGKPAFCANVHDDPRCTRNTCKDLGLKSVATVPLVAGDEIMGVIGLGTYRERDFSMEQDFLQSLAHEITMGLKNALLFEEIQKHTLELEERLAELKRANEEKDSLQTQLLQAQRMEAIGILSGGIAHDFNNLLQVIQGYTDLALFEIKEGDKGYRQLREIRKAAKDSAELTEGLLTFSRRIESKLRPVDVNQEIGQLAAMIYRTFPKMIDIQVDLEEPIRTISADPSQLHQVLMNLAVNARDAMPEGGTLSIETRNVNLDDEYCRKHLGTKPGDYVLVSVLDNGMGMEEKTSERIFDPFFSTKDPGKGTGLGLSIAYGIVKSHGGHILCHSELGKGSSFQIYLPALVEESFIASDTVRIEEPMGGTETLLIIDDEDKIRDVATELLSNFGYRILTATNGKEGVRLYREKADEIDLVVLDLIMPEMGGRQCLEDILQINPSAKIVVASGYPADGQLKEVREVGAVAILTKPYDATKLLELVREVLDN